MEDPKPRGPQGSFAKSLAALATSGMGDNDSLLDEIATVSPQQLRGMVISALSAVNEQKREIEKMNRKMDALIKLLMEQKQV